VDDPDDDINLGVIILWAVLIGLGILFGAGWIIVLLEGCCG
jgi:hypothetical protein